MYAHTYIQSRLHITHMLTQTHTYMHTHTYTHIYAHICTLSYMQTHTHVYMHSMYSGNMLMWIHKWIIFFINIKYLQKREQGEQAYFESMLKTWISQIRVLYKNENIYIKKNICYIQNIFSVICIVFHTLVVLKFFALKTNCF